MRFDPKSKRKKKLKNIQPTMERIKCQNHRKWNTFLNVSLLLQMLVKRKNSDLFFSPPFLLAAKTTTTDIDITLQNECARNSFQIPNEKNAIKNHPTGWNRMAKKLCNQC